MNPSQSNLTQTPTQQKTVSAPNMFSNDQPAMSQDDQLLGFGSHFAPDGCSRTGAANPAPALEPQYWQWESQYEPVLFAQNSDSSYQTQNNDDSFPDSSNVTGFQPQTTTSSLQSQNNNSGFQDQNNNYGYQSQKTGYGYQTQKNGYGYQAQKSGYGYQAQKKGNSYQNPNTMILQPFDGLNPQDLTLQDLENLDPFALQPQDDFGFSTQEIPQYHNNPGFGTQSFGPVATDSFAQNQNQFFGNNQQFVFQNGAQAIANATNIDNVTNIAKATAHNVNLPDDVIKSTPVYQQLKKQAKDLVLLLQQTRERFDATEEARKTFEHELTCERNRKAKFVAQLNEWNKQYEAKGRARQAENNRLHEENRQLRAALANAGIAFDLQQAQPTTNEPAIAPGQFSGQKRKASDATDIVDLASDDAPADAAAATSAEQTASSSPAVSSNSSSDANGLPPAKRQKKPLPPWLTESRDPASLRALGKVTFEQSLRMESAARIKAASERADALDQNAQVKAMGAEAKESEKKTEDEDKKKNKQKQMDEEKKKKDEEKEKKKAEAAKNRRRRQAEARKAKKEKMQKQAEEEAAERKRKEAEEEEETAVMELEDLLGGDDDDDGNEEVEEEVVKEQVAPAYYGDEEGEVSEEE